MSMGGMSQNAGSMINNSKVNNGPANLKQLTITKNKAVIDSLTLASKKKMTASAHIATSSNN